MESSVVGQAAATGHSAQAGPLCQKLERKMVCPPGKAKHKNKTRVKQKKKKKKKNNNSTSLPNALLSYVVSHNWSPSKHNFFENSKKIFF
jgi:hypothetical protein